MDRENHRTSPRRRLVEAALIEANQDVYRFLRRRLGNDHDAKDVLQDFHVRVLSRFDSLRDEDRLRGWMSRILQSVLADHYRAKHRHGQLRDALSAEPLPETDAEDIDLLICACLYKLLPTLKPRQAELIWRADLMGEERERLAADLGISAATLRVRLHRARQALRARLMESCLTCVEHGFFDCACPQSERLRVRLAALQTGKSRTGDSQSGGDGQTAL